METSHQYEFGPFRLDVGNARLLRDGEPVALEPKTFEVLTLLVRRAGSLVEKDALMREVWPDTFVEEANVPRHIWTLRKALGEKGADERYIETVPKRGYRFTADVRTIDPAPDLVAVRRTETRIISREETVIDGGPEASAVPQLPAAVAPSSRRRWILAVVAVSILTVGGSWVVWVRKPPPPTSREAILLADIENRTGAPVFDDTIKTALAVGLEQSPHLRVLSNERVRETLVLTGRTRDAHVTGEVAREVCQRERTKAMLAGAISTLGSHYVISLDATECRTGESLAREQVEADSKEHVVASLGRAMASLRAKLGESMASIQAFDAPLERATTSSLEALKAFSTGRSMRYVVGAAGELETVPFFNRAIELDPDFASAYHFLARIYQNGNRNLERARHFATEAFARRDRVSDFERLTITAAYHYTVTLDWDKAIAAFEVCKQRYPRAAELANNLGTIYANLGMGEKEVESREEGVRRNPHDAVYIGNLAVAYAGENRFADPKRVLDGAIARGQTPRGNPLLYQIAFVAGDRASMQREVDAAMGRAAERRLQNSYLGVLTFGGQYRAARELIRSRGSSPAGELRTAADRETLVGNDAHATRLIAETLAKEVSPQGGADAAVTLALAGESARAQRLIDDIASQFRDSTAALTRIVLPTARAALALRNGHGKEAVAQLEPVLPSDSAQPLSSYVRGRAFLIAGDGTGAAREFRTLLERRGRLRVNVLFPLAHLGLGRALAVAGDATGAAKAYQEFFTFWKDADPDIPILIEARTEFVALKR